MRRECVGLTVGPKGQRKPEIALTQLDVALHGEEKVRELLRRKEQVPHGVLDTGLLLYNVPDATGARRQVCVSADKAVVWNGSHF